MPTQIVLQPDGKFALWSSIVDDFTLIDATPEEVIETLVERQRRQITSHVNTVCSALQRGEKPIGPRPTFDECVQTIREAALRPHASE